MFCMRFMQKYFNQQIHIANTNFSVRIIFGEVSHSDIDCHIQQGGHA